MSSLNIMSVETVIGFVKDERFSHDKFLTFADLIKEKSIDIYTSTHIPSIPGVPRFEGDIDNNCMLVVFGGDGTMLRALKNHPNMPTVGINCGSFGFLCEFEVDELTDAISFIVEGEWQKEHINIIQGNYDDKEYMGINECVISGADTGRPVDLRVIVDGVTMFENRGDGLIIATPNGSTAYNIAEGGAIIAPNVAAIAITPIAPFLTLDRSVILGHDKIVQIVNLERNRSCKVFYDGNYRHKLGPGEKFVVEPSENQSVFLRRQGSFSRRMSLKISNRYPIR